MSHKTSAMSLSSISLKRQHNVNEEYGATENIIQKPPFKKRILSLRKNRRKKEVSPTVLNIRENDIITSNDKQNCLHNEDLLASTTDNSSNLVQNRASNNINEDVNVAVDENDINIRDPSEEINRVDIAIDHTLNGTPSESNNQTVGSINTRIKSCVEEKSDDCIIVNDRYSLLSVSSATEMSHINESLETIIYYDKPYPLSLGLEVGGAVNIDTKNSNIRRVLLSGVDNYTDIDCEKFGNTEEYNNYQLESKSNKQQEKEDASVSLEFKKNNLPTSVQSKVLILKTNAIEKFSHVIDQNPSYKSFRRKIQTGKISVSNKRSRLVRSAGKNGKVSVDGVKLNQTRVDSFFRNSKDSNGIKSANKEKKNCVLGNDISNYGKEVLGHNDMSRVARADTARSDGVGHLSRRVNRQENVLCSSAKMSNRDPNSRIRTSTSETPQSPSPRYKNESGSSCSPRRNVDSMHFHFMNKAKINKAAAVVPRDIPYYKIVAGTHFAVDAFCYGDITGVSNYFLTHFHSDHYSGLKKTFNKVLYCTQITADLCTSRLGVNLKYIRVINIDETIVVDGVDVTPIDANHCPGAVMLLFTLPNGKTLLHTGDFRATPAMESHPAFWNSDIHTIYLDTTYCNPQYDFPTQDQSLEIALHILRQKKMSLEKIGKKFASVLIVCGTYTIGKEKFFLGLARRVGCAVWACPEKDKVLQTVEKRTFSHGSPKSCQLHVVPMRDLTHEKLRCYLDSLQGPFNEVVAFKPSGWENEKSTPVIKDSITIHGIPYSEHSSFSEMLRFVNFLKPKQVVPTVDITGGIKAVQKYFPCPLVYKEDLQNQSKLTDFFSTQNRQQISAVN